MQLLRDLKAYFISNGITDETYLDAIDDQPDTAIALYTYDSMLFGGQIAGGTSYVQIVARALKAQDAYNLAKRAMDTLIVDNEIVQLTVTRWAKVSVSQSPIKIKTDEKNRVYYGFNISIISYVS